MTLPQLRAFWATYQAKLGDIAALLGGIAYAVQSWGFAHSLLSRLDEGMYMVKGFYFATGRYWPYQDYGVLTNHMPLSFLVPGYWQTWFGPGIRAGRYQAVLLGILMVVALWVVARRLGGRWWGAAAVWALALNTSAVKGYSLVLSQGLVACLLTVSLAFVLGENRKTWHLVAGGFLAGVVMMTRINLTPLVPAVLLYIFWQHGRRNALWAALAASVPIISLHIVYWPGILRKWAYWIPQGWLPFLEPWYAPWHKTFGLLPPKSWEWLLNLEDPHWNVIVSFWHGARFNFLAFVGALAVLLLWPRRTGWKSEHQFRITLTFTGLYFLLVAMHAWAALGGNSCHLFCYYGYLQFFYPLGLLLVVASFSAWREDLPLWRNALTALVVILVFAGIAFGASAEIGRPLAEMSVPRISNFSIQPGTVQLWGLLQNKFGLTYQESRQIVPAAFGLAVGLLLAIGIVPAYRWFVVRKGGKARGYAWSLMVITLTAGLVLSPTQLLGGGDHTYDCGGDVLTSYEVVGAQLAEYVKPGEQVYWRAGNSTVPLLYIPDAKIYPPQLNDVFSFANTDGPHDPDELLRYGLWNEELKQQWIAEADVILVEGRRFVEEWQGLVEQGQFEVEFVTDPMEACRGHDARIYVLRPVK